VHPFYHRRVVKDLQEFVDAPSMWGVCYRDKEDLKASWRPLREKYHAQDAFLGVEDKTTFRAADDNMFETSIPYWRMVNEYGWYWWVKLPAAAVAVLAMLVAMVVGSNRVVQWALLHDS
jgi:hypothetical protein